MRQVGRRVEPTLTRGVGAAARAGAVSEAPMAGGRSCGRDPAPSRAAYRLHRMWLTPFYRALMCRGLPAFAAILGVGLVVQDPARREAVSAWAENLRASIAERPEFMVGLLRIEGATETTAAAVRAALGLSLPASSFDMDLDALHARVAALPAVAAASLHVRRGGVLDVAVVERVPAVVWRNGSGIRTLDATGHPVADLLGRLERPDLPLIVGEGADARVPEALRLVAAAGPLGPRVRGLIRIGTRRWDVVVEPAIRLMLPEADPVPALERIVALHEAQALLDRDVVAVDLRNPSRATVRMGVPAAETYRQTVAVLKGASRR